VDDDKWAVLVETLCIRRLEFDAVIQPQALYVSDRYSTVVIRVVNLLILQYCIAILSIANTDFSIAKVLQYCLKIYWQIQLLPIPIPIILKGTQK